MSDIKEEFKSLIRIGLVGDEDHIVIRYKDVINNLDRPASIIDCPGCEGRGYVTDLELSAPEMKPCTTCKGHKKLVACIVWESEIDSSPKEHSYPITRAYHADHADEFLANKIEIKYMPYEEGK